MLDKRGGGFAPGFLTSTLRAVRGEAGWIAIDGALASATSVLVVIAAARALPPPQLAIFAVIQLAVVSVQLLQRAAILAPALASQRQQGRGVVPLRWAGVVGLPFGVAGACATGAYLAVAGVLEPTLAFAVAITQCAITCMDAVRYRLFSALRARRAALIDGVALAVLALAFGVALFADADELSLAGLMCLWGGVLAAATLAAVATVPRAHGVDRLGLGPTWKLGKWSGLDQAMSVAASLLPFVVTGLALGSDLAGPYRVMQTALGPLNVVVAAVVTSMALGSWALVDLASLDHLAIQVKRLFRILTVAASAYLIVATVILAWAADVDESAVLRVSIVVLLAGAIGAATVPFVAAANALGYQRYGVTIRAVTLSGVIAIAALSVSGSLGASPDAIGASTLFASLVGVAGWYLAFRRAMRRERLALV
jgi:hypothetical protein